MPRLPKTDLALQSQGRWVEYVPGLEFRVASMRSPEYQAATRRTERAVRDQTATLRRRNNGQALTSEQEEEIVELRERMTREDAARHLVTDWRGLEDEEGNEVPHSPDVAAKYLTDTAYLDAVLFVVASASAVHEYRVTAKEEAKGN